MTDPASRRDFLHQAAGLAAGIGAAAAPAAAAELPSEPLLPTIKLGRHSITRLIIGGNPIYGYSHFNKLLSKHQTDWHTPERVVELLRERRRLGEDFDAAWRFATAQVLGNPIALGVPG